jgi:hypothetical protein
MKRDMDLVRLMLLRIERTPSAWATQPFGIQYFAPQQVRHHAQIMIEDGLIEGSEGTDTLDKSPEGKPLWPTWKGHEFLDMARNEQRWNKAKQIITKIGSAPFAVWIRVLNDLILKELILRS